MKSPSALADAPVVSGGVRHVRMRETRARLFDAALAEIGRSGLAGADVTAIANAADVVRGTFYFHFPTKEHVLVELERSEEARIVGQLDVAQTETGDLVSVLLLLVRHVLAAEHRWVRWSSLKCSGCTSPRTDRPRTRYRSIRWPSSSLPRSLLHGSRAEFQQSRTLSNLGCSS